MSPSGPPFVGVDWDSGSWIAVSYHADGTFKSIIKPTINQIWDHYGKHAGRLVIDIPIGLCKSFESENCACELDYKDELVRTVTGLHGKSSKPPVPRPFSTHLHGVLLRKQSKEHPILN